MNAFGRLIKAIVEGPLARDALAGTVSMEGCGSGQMSQLNSAFILTFYPSENPSHQKAMKLLQEGGNASEDLGNFFLRAKQYIHRELELAQSGHPDFVERLRAGAERLEQADRNTAQRVVHEILFPEANLRFQQNYIQQLRAQRVVRIVRPNPMPVTDPAREVLFTANALLTVPETLTEEHIRRIGTPLCSSIEDVMAEEQLYWYDHPVEVGCPDEENEILYGLWGLSDALRFEQRARRVPSASGLTVVLSASVTHRGLQCLVRPYLRRVLSKRPYGLEVFVFTEEDTQTLVDEVFGPLYYELTSEDITPLLREVFGVDGEYGRHYSFLKAVAGLWQVVMNPHLKGTFKIDLDQVFPQEALQRQTGMTAFEHLCTALWGAEGIDSAGEAVRLGLLAGALVNEKDISKGLFVPDVVMPERDPLADEVVFHSQVPQALSTEAEMLCRYIPGTEIDGLSTCIQRVHVTGGTTGALVEDLFRYRPFTPTFIGRAEDQAYLMSVLFEGSPKLRYLHRAGLFMRHDKAAFAQRAIKRAEAGKKVGDYLRIIWFSLYAKALPWPVAQTKEALEPFTGAFIHPLPFTMACLRLALRAVYMFNTGQTTEAEEFLRMGARRLNRVMKLLEDNPGFVSDRFNTEKQAWNAYYRCLEYLRQGIKRADTSALKYLHRARQIVNSSRL